MLVKIFSLICRQLHRPSCERFCYTYFIHGTRYIVVSTTCVRLEQSNTCTMYVCSYTLYNTTPGRDVTLFMRYSIQSRTQKFRLHTQLITHTQQINVKEKCVFLRKRQRYTASGVGQCMCEIKVSGKKRNKRRRHTINNVKRKTYGFKSENKRKQKYIRNLNNTQCEKKTDEI